MVLSANENLPPKKATPDKPPPPILHSNKSWARILRGNVQTSSTPSNPRTSLNTTNCNTIDSSLSESQLRQIATYSERPILKGTVPDSLFIDISTVSNKLLFIQELAAACEGNKHLWSVEDVIRRDFHKAFAEITVSPSFREKICSHGVKLPSFDQLFIGYPSLSSDADILKISFANLPRQYGRGNGGLLELQADMHENLSAFGKVLNCGTMCGLAGVYSGRGYAVLELHQSESSPKLPHVIPWNYTDICSTDPKPNSVEVYATWKSMDPYCRYCHGNDHALLNCPKKLSKVTCYNCHGQGHKSKSCPRRNEGGGKKTRKSYESVSEETPSKVLSPSVPLNDPATLSVPPSTIETVDPAASTTSSTQRSKYATVPRMVTRSKSSVSPSSSSLNESTVSPRRCPHCQLEGHVTTRARACLKNPIRLAENANVDHSAFQEDDFVREPIDKQPTDTVDIDMADDTFGFSAESIANLEFQHGHDEAQDGLKTRTACPLHERANIPAHNSNPITSSSLKIATMNCRGLRKSSDPSSSSQFIRYLRTHSLDILALQETHADTPQLQDLFHKQFQASDSLWSPHCGLVCFSPVLSFSNTVFSVCGRIITTTISHQSNIFDPVSVSVIYAPASRNARYVFFSNVLQGDFSSLPSNPSRHILLGDFNYSYASHLSPRSRRPQAPDHWLSHIHSYYVDGVTPSDQAALPTFHRGTQQSCIDYIFISRDLVSTQSLGRVHYIQPTWTDHFMVSLRIPLLTSASNNDTSAIGKGLWRAHPRLATDPAFCKLLTTSISRTIATLDDTVPVELRWDALKSTVKQTAQSFSRKSAFTLAKAETLLQKKRHGLLKKIKHNPECANVISPQLKIVEAQLTDIQQYHVETLALRAGIRWRELGELSPGYLKRTVATRSARQLIPPLLHPTHLTLSSTRDEMLDAASTFYKNLYSPQPVEQGAIDDLIGAIPEHLRLSEVDRSILVSPITYHDLLEGASRAPIRSSPGMDGLPYELLSLLIQHPKCRSIALAVFNNALKYGVFPPSWLETCVTLLPKKGDLSALKNWRPISLINTDAKLFTRIVNSRLIPCANQIVTPFQTGFVRGRFIADNGLLTKLAMAHARTSRSTAIGLMLDQEKAYDRVHPEYLRQVLLRLGLPASIVHSLSSLFFGTYLRLNVNGFLSTPVLQQRGLRQGDPISPVLFNLAFEPLLRRIIHDPHFQGFALPRSSLSHPLDFNLQPVKLLAYADDVICFLKDPTDLNVLLEHLSLYARASNAQVNYHKTLAISLSGASIATSSIWRGSLLAHHITQWHDCTSSLPAVYLGFPLCSSTTQRNRFLALLLEKIQKACQIHSQRALSIRGRVTILNSLILSKLWHVLRLTTVPKQFLGQVRSVMSSFLTYRMFPKIGFSTMCLPRHAGGLGVLDPGVQQGALQLRWITPLLSNVPVGPLASFWTSKGIRFSIVLARLADYLLHCLEDLQASSPHTWPLADYRLSFLFPDLRPPRLRGLDSPFALLFGAIDILPADYQQVVPSANTCLQLPVSACLRAVPNTPLNRSLRQLRLSSPYIRDIDSNLLRPRTAMEFHVHPYLARKFLRLVRKNHILLAPFLVRPFIPVQYASLGSHPFTPDLTSAVDASPFLLSRKLITVDNSRCLNSRLFRRLCILPTSGPKVLFPLPPDGWRQFWKIPLSHSCRNVWYRLLHHKLPTRSNLHRLLPSIFPSPSCLNCPDQEETLEHFLYLCPQKLLVWQSIWNEHFPTQYFSSFSVAHALFQLKFPPVPASSFDISSAAIIGHTLLSVWRAHWAFIFDNIPIQTSVILNSSQKLSRQLHHETLVQTGCSHRALLHWSLV